MSSSAGEGKLIGALIGSALAGAVLGVTIFKLMEDRKGYGRRRKKRDHDLHHTDSFTSRPSFIFDDPSNDVDRQVSSRVLFPHNHEERMRRRIYARAAVEEENSTPRTSVTVRVPATSANVGPGCKFFFTGIPKI